MFCGLILSIFWSYFAFLFLGMVYPANSRFSSLFAARLMLRAKRPHRQRARRNGCFRRLGMVNLFNHKCTPIERSVSKILSPTVNSSPKPFFFLNAIEVKEMKDTSKKEINDWVKEMQKRYPSEDCGECHICLSKLFIIIASRNVYYTEAIICIISSFYHYWLRPEIISFLLSYLIPARFK